MSTAVLVGLGIAVLAALVVGLVLASRARRAPAEPTRPRTVAELVALRAEQSVEAAAEPEPEPPGPPADEQPPVEPTPAEAPRRAPEPEAPLRRAAAALPRVLAGRRRAEPAADLPPPEPPAPRPPAAEPAVAEIELGGDDTPWRRGALMAAGAGSGAPIDVVPKPVPPSSHAGLRIEEPPVWNEPGDGPEDDEWTGWADWDAVDAEVEAETRMPTRKADERGRLVAAGRVEPSADDRETGGAGAVRTAGHRPAEPPPAAANSRPTPVDPALAAAPAPADPDDDPEAVPPDAAPARQPRRPLRTPAEQAAEQAAVDLALLRTFGYADPGLRPDTAPVVSLVSRADDAAPVVSGDPQPVRFLATDHRGKPVGQAAVTLLDDRGQQIAATTADAGGAGALLAPHPGAFMLVARAPGHQAGASAVTVADAATAAEVVLTRSAAVYGVVLGEDGPIAGARVTLVQDGEIVDAVDTGPDGAYRLDDVVAGEYGLSVAAAGCEPFAALAVVPDETDLCRDVELEPALPQADRSGGDRHDGGQDAAGCRDVAEMLLGGGQAGPPGR